MSNFAAAKARAEATVFQEVVEGSAREEQEREMVAGAAAGAASRGQLLQLCTWHCVEVMRARFRRGRTDDEAKHVADLLWRYAKASTQAIL